MQIENTLLVEDMSNHHEVFLILSSVKEKLNVMATVYDVVEQNKKDNKFLNNWLGDYENLIELSQYADWLADDIKSYQRLIKEYSSSFFDSEMHKEALNNLSYYINGDIGKNYDSGTIKEMTDKLKKWSGNLHGLVCDLEKAKPYILGDKRTESFECQAYEFVFYYIIH